LHAKTEWNCMYTKEKVQYTAHVLCGRVGQAGQGRMSAFNACGAKLLS
jgi:hypothetical protein